MEGIMRRVTNFNHYKQVPCWSLVSCSYTNTLALQFFFSFNSDDHIFHDVTASVQPSYKQEQVPLNICNLFQQYKVKFDIAQGHDFGADIQAVL